MYEQVGSYRQTEQDGSLKSKGEKMTVFTTTLPNAFPQFNNGITNIITNTITTTNSPENTSKFKAKKVGTNGNHYFLILDESGSMSNLKNDTIGGVNTLIQKQIEDKDGTKMTIVKFEGGHVRIPVDNLPVEEIGHFKDYSPLGGTNLLDAIGITMEKINSYLKSLKRKDRPSIFIQIITDGAENMSRNFNKNTVKEMIESATESDWVISYVGANVNSFSEASSIGIHASAACDFSTQSIAQTYTALAGSNSRLKTMRSVGATAEALYTTNSIYTDVEKKLMGE